MPLTQKEASQLKEAKAEMKKVWVSACEHERSLRAMSDSLEKLIVQWDSLVCDHETDTLICDGCVERHECSRQLKKALAANPPAQASGKEKP